MMVIKCYCRLVAMAEGDGTFYKAVMLLGVTFGVGFFAGYKVNCLYLWLSVKVLLPSRLRSSEWNG